MSKIGKLTEESVAWLSRVREGALLQNNVDRGIVEVMAADRDGVALRRQHGSAHGNAGRVHLNKWLTIFLSWHLYREAPAKKKTGVAA